MSALHFVACGGDVIWRPEPGMTKALTMPEARAVSLHILEAAEDARMVSDVTAFDSAIELFHTVNDAIRNAMRWRQAAGEVRT